MAYYDALIARWATLNPGTTQQKLAQINAQVVASGPAQKLLVPPSDIINAIAPADFAALTDLDIQRLTLLLQGQVVDASQGTLIRAALANIFTGKATTLANFAALQAKYDTPSIPWWQANGYSSPISKDDASAAGLS